MCRQTIHLLAILLFVGSVASTASAGETPKGKGTDQAGPPGLIVARSPKHDHEFAWYVPKASAKAKNVPFVVSFHGASGSGPGEIKGWLAQADKHGFAVICPTSVLAGAGVRAGTPIRITPEAFTEESEAVLSMLDLVKASVSLDPQRSMVTGYSGGGNPSYWLGLFHADTFRFMCTRCGNFPGLLRRLIDADPAFAAKAKAAAETVDMYIFWGEKDHPIILGEIEGTIAFIDSLKPVMLKKEMIPGMKHENSAARAAEWFVARLLAQLKAAKDAGKKR